MVMMKTAQGFLGLSLVLAGLSCASQPNHPPQEFDFRQFEYHTNYRSTQAKIRTPEEGFHLWMKHHNELKDRVREGPVDLLMIGDSIVFRWERDGREVWETFYGERNAVQIGSSGDYTDHVLWRIQNGALETATPKLTVLLIGTNNTGLRKDPAEETAYGIEAIIKEIKKRMPGSKILLLAILPRGNRAHANPDRLLAQDALAASNAEVNLLIQDFADDERVYYLDLGHIFQLPDGTLDPALMPDFVHPGAEGFQVWAEALEPHIKLHLGE
ncbi:MAG: lysophospholipase L1-like esterase [Planctomycetota bacterium]|jgi:lysophospholipase L1-like esterase